MLSLSRTVNAETMPTSSSASAIPMMTGVIDRLGGFSARFFSDLVSALMRAGVMTFARLFRFSLRSSLNMSSALWYLSSGFFAIDDMIRVSSPFGIFRLISRGRTGSAFMCIMTTDIAVSSSKGSLPVAISYIMMPSE